MAKGFSIFITLAIGIAVIVGGVLWWIGPSLANLAFFDSRRSEPYVVIEFLRAAHEPLQNRYVAPLQQLVNSEGGQAMASYQLQHVANGRSRDEWNRVVFYQIPQAQDVAQIMTSSPYSLMQDSISELRAIRLGTYASSSQAEWQDTLLVFLIVPRQTAQLDPMSSLLADATASAGRVVLDAQVNALDSEVAWQRMLVMDFASQRQALDWLNSPAMVTERDIVNSANREFAVLLLQR